MQLKTSLSNLDQRQLFGAFVSFWIGLGWLGLILSYFSLFYVHFFLAYFALGFLFFIFILQSGSIHIKLTSSIALFIFLSFSATIIFLTFSTPSVFSGRDQGAFSEAAIQLAQNHRLSFSFDAEKEFFQIYQTGKALNFPGFLYTPQGELTSQFPSGYIAWLAIFYSLFGINGFLIANSLSFLLFVFSFYLLSRLYLRTSSALIATLLIFSSFLFSWFFKFTLSENIGLLLTWFGIYSFILFIREKKRFHLLTTFFSFGFLLFVRVEAWAFLAVIFLILLSRHPWKNILFQLIGKKILLLVGSFLLVYFLHLLFDIQTLFFSLKNMLYPFLALFFGLKNHVQSPSLSFFDTLFYTLKVLWTYGILTFILFALASLAKLWKKKQWEILFPLLIVLPSFIYIFYPSISSDHPWMLRRFLFSVLPASIFYTVWFFEHTFPKKSVFYFFSTLLILNNLSISLPYLTLIPNKTLLVQTQTIGSYFKNSDLILIDREASGDGWNMLTGPLNFLYGKQAIYFFNPQDLEKIDRKKFTGIYFIIPDKQLSLYENNGLLEKLTPLKEYSLSRNDLDINLEKRQSAYRSPIVLPREKEFITRGKIYQLK